MALRNEYREFLGQLGVVPKLFIPISAKLGDNIATKSANMPWYTGPNSPSGAR